MLANKTSVFTSSRRIRVPGDQARTRLTNIFLFR
jgi:hypothetical protein